MPEKPAGLPLPLPDDSRKQIRRGNSQHIHCSVARRYTTGPDCGGRI